MTTNEDDMLLDKLVFRTTSPLKDSLAFSRQHFLHPSNFFDVETFHVKWFQRYIRKLNKSGH